MKIKVTEILHVKKKKENKLYFLKTLNKNKLVFLLNNARKTCIFMRSVKLKRRLIGLQDNEWSIKKTKRH